MKKKFFKVLALLVVLLLGLQINRFFNQMRVKPQESTPKGTTHSEALRNIEFINGVYGLYSDSDGIIHVIQGKDKDHMYICGYFYRRGYFRTDNLRLTKNKNNEIMATEKIYPDADDTEWLYYLFAENQFLEYLQMDVIFKDNKINLIFNNDTKWEFEKLDVTCITEETKKKALNNILDSDFSDIDRDIFEIVHNTDNYLVIRVKSYVLGTYGYETEGSDFGMYKYYNIEKKTKKILNLNDIIKNTDDLNEYIINYIEANRDRWIAEGRDNYKEFKRIGQYEWFENYFEVDEDKNIVKIRCLSYPCEANREMGDLNLDIPFSFFKLN